MPELARYTLSAGAGGLLGVLFFGGLWWTVRKSLRSARPALCFVGSLLLRMSMALAGITLVSSHDLRRLLCCLLGFALPRPLVTWWTRPSSASPPAPSCETTHAS